MTTPRALILSVCGLLPAILQAHRLPVQIYTVADGLPRNSASCLTPGQNGVMWICTTEGLVRFDGWQMRVFGPADGLPSRIVLGMTAAKGGGYWVVTDKGICRLESQSKIGEPCRVWPGGGNNINYFGAEVHETRDGRAWLRTQTEVIQLDVANRRIDTGSPRFHTGDYYVNSIADGMGSELLLGTDKGLFRWAPGQAPLRIASITGGVTDILNLGSGIYWVTCEIGLVLVRLEGDGQQQVFAKILLKEPSSNTGLYRGPSGRIWAGSLKILFQLEVLPGGFARVVQSVTAAEGIRHTVGDLLAEDSQGALWGSAGGAGVFRLYNSGVRSYSSEDGLGGARIAAIFEDRSGRVCVITSPGDLRVFDGTKFNLIQVPYEKGRGYGSWGSHQFALQARNGEWFFPSRAGLLRFAPARVEELRKARLMALYGSEKGLTEVFRIFEDAKENIWVACLTPGPQIAQWERRTGRIINYSVPEHPLIRVFREREPGDLWLGTNNGIYHLRDDRFEAVNLHLGHSYAVPDMLFDRRGRLWAGGLRGVLRVDHPDQPNPAYAVYKTADGLSANAVRALVEGRDGYIYAGTVAGVDRIDPDAAPSEHKVRRFGNAAGMPRVEPWEAFQDSAGRIWIGSEFGLTSIDLSASLAQAPPLPFISRVQTRGVDQPMPWDGSRHPSIELPSDSNQVEIAYAATSSEPGTHFQYRLGDGAWNDQFGPLALNYPVLPYGDSRFELRAINAEGEAGGEMATLDLTVRAPFWRRGWFLALAAGALVGLGTLLYRARVAQLLAIANLRTEIATDLHDDVGANLTQIAILSEVAQRDGKAGLLKDISAIARDTVAQMSDIVWAISPAPDAFDSLVHRLRRYAEDTLGGAGIEAAFDVSALEKGVEVPLEVRRPLFLVAKEAIRNVGRHSHASNAWIALEVGHGRVSVTVDDDGVGFDLSQVEAGEGIASIKRRASEFGGGATWTVREGRGTRVAVSIPFRGKRRKKE